MYIVTTQPRHCNNPFDTSKCSLPSGYLPLTWVSYSAIISFSLRNFAGDVIAVRSRQTSGNYLSWVMGRNIGKKASEFLSAPGLAVDPAIDSSNTSCPREYYCFLKLLSLSALWVGPAVGFFKWLFLSKCVPETVVEGFGRLSFPSALSWTAMTGVGAQKVSQCSVQAQATTTATTSLSGCLPSRMHRGINPFHNAQSHTHTHTPGCLLCSRILSTEDNLMS